MVRPKVRKKQYDPRQMIEAVEMVRKKGLNLRQAAEQYRVPMSTLWDKVTNRVPLRLAPSTVILSPEEEKEIVDWIKWAHRSNHCVRKGNLLSDIQRILKSQGKKTPFKDNRPGYTWLQGFLHRHPEIMDKVELKKDPSKKDPKERTELVTEWFEEVKVNLLKDGIDIRTIDPKCMFITKLHQFSVGTNGQGL
ncbi:tigger transposable element-derived protein 6-like protein [Elysia marginata]|uniref:Tigger transposable element-derived protein 6-like protein n=1 Tax=Elysia marginata TaxID=1093978 RepID=A0AAV4EU43_9GAST|nr:tigger transposable element-derived protein 6-like protein [Elysia marginata]